MTRTFNREFLMQELGLPWGGQHKVLDEVTDTSRWSIYHRLIFKHEGKFWETHYGEGATECQDEEPWDGETEVECTEVHQVEKLVKVWEAV